MIHRVIGMAALAAVVFAPTASGQDVIGTWKIIQEMRGQSIESTLTIEKAGDGLAGSWQTQRGPTEIRDLKLDGETLKFARTLEFGQQSIEIDYEVKVVDGKLMGKAITQRGEREFTGTRVGDAGTFIGDWQVTLDFQGQEVQANLSVSKSDDGKLGGVWKGQRAEGELANVKIDGDTLTFSRDVERQGQSFSIEYSAKLVDGKLDGTMKTPRGDMKFTGKKLDAATEGGGRAAQRLARLDTDGDGKISEQEAPDRMKQGFSRVDSNGDGFIDRAELETMLELIRSRGGAGNE